MQIILLIFFIFNFISCEETKNPGEKKIIFRDQLENIDVLSISYELTYNISAVVKVTIKCLNDLEGANTSFKACLLSDKEEKEYEIQCQNTSETIIECYSKNEKFNTKDKFSFYYERGDNGKYTFDEKDTYTDFRRVSLIFKPEIEQDQIMYLDHRKIIGFNNRRVVGGGYLYLVRKSKKLSPPPKDGFNPYIDLNNYIFQPYWKLEITPRIYKDAIKKGFHIVEAKIQFTKDKEPIIFQGELESKTLKELQREKFILTLSKLLSLCKENNVIIELNLAELDNNRHFEEYMNIVIDTIKEYEMLNSTYFNDGGKYDKLLKLKEIEKDISVCISDHENNIKKGLKELKGIKRIIINYEEKKLKKKEVENAISQGHKVKVSNVNNLEYANELQNWGVNYIATHKIHPFLMNNEYEEPILMECTQFDILVNCVVGPEVKLIDNEIYSIYYSRNIYELNKDIIDKPIGEFKYLDTKKLDDIFYTIPEFDLNNKYLLLNSSVKIPKDKRIIGCIGPEGYHAPEIYQYKFYCDGNDKFDADCYIDRDDKRVIKFFGNYSVYGVENYSRYIEPSNETEVLFFKLGAQRNMSNITFVFCVIFISLLFTIIFYYINRKSFCPRLRNPKYSLLKQSN